MVALANAEIWQIRREAIDHYISTIFATCTREAVRWDPWDIQYLAVRMVDRDFGDYHLVEVL